MNEIIAGIIAGSVGGAIRTIVTISYSMMDKNRLNYFNIFFYLITFILTGALSGLIFGPGIILPFVMGFVGVDLLDTYYKAVMKKDISTHSGKKTSK